MNSRTYTERKGTTRAGRIRAATHAVVELRTWEWPENVPAGTDWYPTVGEVIAKTRSMYRITPDAAEAQQAVDTIKARNPIDGA